MPDWNTRLAVSYQDETGTHAITPIDSFTPTFALNAEVMHSVESTHIGYIYSPQAMSFSLTVKAIGDVAAQLTTLALQGTRFDIVLQESDGGTDWSFKKVVMGDCVITSATPSNATVTGAPTATFSGVSLAAQSEPKTGSAVTIP
jgi:hypothetical protein